MKQIKMYFDNIKQAEIFLNKLYNKYNFVQLVSFPMFTENGTYIFSVK